MPHNYRVIRRLKACLNGGRMQSFVPRTPAELAADAVAVAAAGAEAVHIHPRGTDGRESLAAADVGAAVAAVRAAGVPVGVSTGLWIAAGDAARRRAAIEGWTVLPDFASVNVGEDGYDDLVALLKSRGVAVEAGVWTPEEADRTGPVDRILVEVLDTPADRAIERADAVLARLDTGTPILLHGEQDACWPLVAHAGRLGLPTRIGWEDTLTGPAGEPVRDNAELVRLALRRWSGGA
jgi:uncharacterized protein (DUF849 family)